MSEILLEAKCSTTVENNEQETALFEAVNAGNYRFAQYLLSNGMLTFFEEKILFFKISEVFTSD